MKNTVLLLLLSLFFATSLSAFEFEGKMLASLKVQDEKEVLKTLKKLNIDIAAVSRTEKIIDVVINDIEFKTLRSLNLDPEILMVKGVSRGPDARYKKPNDVERILNEYHAAYPELTELISIGKSLEGRDIWAMKITSAKKENKASLLFNGTIHAREVMTPEVVLDMAEYLLTNYETNSKVSTWVDNLEIWIVPMVNVDGSQKMWTEDSMWRKNTRGGFGVDLNRNFPFGWNSCNGSSGNTWSQTYRGVEAASEPETQVMMSFVEKILPVFSISYHSYSEIVIYPFGCEPHKAKGMVATIGHELANSIGYKAGTAWELLYNADGGDIDWMYHALGVIPYVVELNSRWAGFQPNYELWRDETVLQNRPGWMLLLDKTMGPGLKGEYIGTDVASLEVYKNEKLFMDYPVQHHGKFHLVLDKGEFEVRAVDKNKKKLSQEKFTIANKLIKDVKLGE